MNRDNYEKFENVVYPYIFRKDIDAGTSGVSEVELTSAGFVKQVNINFSAGENGTLQIRPYVILNGGIPQELLQYAEDKYISGDDVKFQLDCYQEIEAGAKLRVAYSNTGAGTSKLIVDVIVHYNDYITDKNIIG